jgi:TolA-binding protein
MQRSNSRSIQASIVAGLALLLAGAQVSAQVPADQAADMLLTSARKAYNEKNYPFAITRFREFLQKFGNHKDAPGARYGLALALIDGPDQDFQSALNELQPLAGNKEFADQPFATYYLALAQRGLGIRALAQATANPAQAAQHRATAQQRFEEAAKQFAAAAALFMARVKTPPAEDRELPSELEWAARSLCDLAEMQLRTQKAQAAQATAAGLLKDTVLARSRYRPLALYYHGFASYLLRDYQEAGKSLNRLTPFSDPVYGTHARYLLARVLQVQDERQEAAVHYEAVGAEHNKQKLAAIELLKQPDRFKTDPAEKARLEALVKGPLPDHVARSIFNLGVLQYEDGKYGEAATRLTAFSQQFPQSPLATEAQLRVGFCQVQQKQFADALKTLPPLADKEPRLADQVLLWVAKAQVGGADPNNPPAHDAALKSALDTLRRAAERAQQLAASDPEAKSRRGDILVELAETQQLARQFKESAATIAQAMNEKLQPRRDEELLQRLATAWHLAGDYGESDKVCLKFRDAYPKSTLLPEVLFRHAENASFAALAAEKANRAQDSTRLHDETIKRYQAVIDKFPEYAHVHLARYGLAQAFYRKGDLEKARDTLEGIPMAERNGALASVSYLLADCLIRLAPTKADDALAVGKLEEQLKQAAELLDAFAGSQPNSPQTPDALLKLGLCHQRLAGLIAQPAERAKAFGVARAAYEKLVQQFPKHELQPQAVFERAKCQAQMGDTQGALNELRRFTTDPLKTTPAAPLAVVLLATLLRGQNKAGEAADLLGKARPEMEPKLLQDPARAGWAGLLAFQQGVALKEAGKLPEARVVFAVVVQQHASRPEGAEAALRLGQCLKDEGLQQVAAARQKLAAPNLKPEESAAAQQAQAAGLKSLGEAITYLEQQAEQWKQRQPVSEARARMHYDAAWCCRTLAELEVVAARAKLQQEWWQKLKDEAARKAPPGKTIVVPLPDVLITEVPLQSSEIRARTNYQALIAAFADLPLASDARFELAELHAERAEHDIAIKLLKETLDKEPPQELADRVRLRLGASLFAKKQTKEALAQFASVAANPKSPLRGQAQYRAGECMMQLGDWAEAVKYLVMFRDQGPFQNLPGVTDRALLRLGHALAELKQWEPSRQAHEQVVNRFGNGPWANEARYGLGWAWQNLKQYDNAVNVYSQVTANTATELAAKAQLQIGLCRLEQRRYPEATTALLVVPYTYDYPELSASALSEAARAFAEQKQHDQAMKLLQRVIKDHPESKWADAARERLEALKGG